MAAASSQRQVPSDVTVRDGKSCTESTPMVRTARQDGAAAEVQCLSTCLHFDISLSLNINPIFTSRHFYSSRAACNMHLFPGHKGKALSEPDPNPSTGTISYKTLKRRCSRFFGSNSLTSPIPACEASRKYTTKHKLRIKASRYFAKMMPSKGDLFPLSSRSYLTDLSQLLMANS